MPLQKRTIDIPLSSGINTKLDRKLVPEQRSVLSSTNTVFDKSGSIRKRNGYASLGRDILGGGQLERGRGLTSLENELVLHDGATIYTRNDSGKNWVSIGDHIAVDVDINNDLLAILASPGQSSAWDIAVTDNGYVGITTIFGAAGGGFIVQDEATGTLITSGVLTQDTPVGTDTFSRVVAIGNVLAFVFINDNFTGSDNVRVQFIDTSLDPTLITSPSTLVSGVDHDKGLDVVRDSDTTAVLVNVDRASGDIELVRFDTAGSVIDTHIHAETAEGPLAIIKQSNGAFRVAFRNTTTGIEQIEVDNGLTTTTASGTITANAAARSDTRQITLIERDNGEITSVHCQFDPGGDSNSDLIIVFNDISGTPAGVATHRGQSLSSKAFSHNDRVYFLSFFSPDLTAGLQNTYFLLDGEGKIGAALLTAAAVSSKAERGFVDGMNASSIVSLGDGRFFGLLGERVVRKGSISSPGRKVVFDFESLKPTFAESNRSIGVSGGLLGVYARDKVHEYGPLAFPTFLSVTPSGSGGSLSDGEIGIALVYSSVDSNGNIYQSIPAITSVTLSGGGSAQSIALDITTLRASNSDPTVYGIDIYVTELGGTIFHFQSTTGNTVTLDSLSPIIITTEGDDTKAVLYTTGGELGNTPAPGGEFVKLKDRRFWVGNDSVIDITKQEILGEALGFNDASLRLRFGGSGRITAFEEMDGNKVVYRENEIRVFSGTGPNALGQGSFSPARLLSSDVGAKRGSPAVLSESGIYSKADKGIYLLNRSLQNEYIGAPVEEFNGENLIAAHLECGSNRVLFVHRDADLLAYDYYHKVWSKWTGLEAKDSIIYRKQHAVLRCNGDVLLRGSDFLDNGVPYSMDVETAWIKFAGLQGFQRLYYTYILGEFRTRHKLNIEISYDFVDVVAETHEFETGDATNDLNLESEAYQIPIKPGRQKCNAIKFRIFDTDAEGTGEGLVLNSLAFEVGIKQGRLNRGARDRS